MRLIYADALPRTQLVERKMHVAKNGRLGMRHEIVNVVRVEDVENAPTVDAVDAGKYNDLREAFVDFVCSGTHNPAPYCKNRCDECVDGWGWCTHQNCRGFNPDGERGDGDDDHRTESRD